VLDCLPFDDRRFTMTQTTAAFATLSVPTPMVLLYIDSVMIKYMKEFHYGVFNNQSCAESDFSLSIGTAQMKRVPIPFMAHKYFLLANFSVLIISHINPFVPRSTLLGRFHDFPFFCHRIDPKGSILCSFLFVNFGANFFQKSRQ
jgi:hypothetical protein